MKYILILTLIYSFQVFAKSPERSISKASDKTSTEVKKTVLKPSKLQKEFLETSGLVLGEYTADTEECLSGNLTITDYGDELYLMFGGESLIVALGKDKVTESYSDCKRTFRSKYSASYAEELSEEICSKEKTITTTAVVPEKDKFTYTVTTVVNDGAPEVIKCTVTRKPSQK